jgi:hypothetical protein
MNEQDRLIDDIASRIAIQDLVVSYAKARDTTDPDLYREIFAQDAAIAIQDAAVEALAGGKVMSANLDEIIAKVMTDQVRFNPGKQPGITSYAVFRHQVSNVLITISGDSARSEYYVDTLAYNETEKRPEVASVARLEDEYRRRNGRWWITKSTLIFGWSNEAMRKTLQAGPHTPAEYRKW